MALDIAAFSQLANSRRLNLRCLREVKLLQCFQSRQLRIANPVFDRVPVAFFAFHCQQGLQVAYMAVVLFDCLLSQRHEVRSHGRHANRLAVLPDTGMLQSLRWLTHWTPPVTGVSNRSYSSITGMGRSNCIS